MYLILLVFFLHWFLSLFFHTAFLHRYCSHQMYTMNKTTERIFYFLTWFFQGSSFLVPRAYGVMHRMHHEYSDTEKDPHSPHFFRDIFQMMWETKKIYNDFNTGVRTPETRFSENLPTWKALDKFGESNIVRLLWVAVYITFYVLMIQYFELSWFWLFLLPIHFLMGPIQGAMVNWFGHKLGYRNYSNGDQSVNTTPVGLLLMGELFQNNHHKYPESINFAQKWYEVDFTYPILKLLHWIGIISIKA